MDDDRYFSGIYVGCFDTAILYNNKYIGRGVDEKTMRANHAANNYSNPDYICESITGNFLSPDEYTHKLCGCDTDYCTRTLADKLTDNFYKIKNLSLPF
uniref:PA2c domain-containing protein n=1 Tax=Rhabditophanes sp. KR3021 TaxID=114890 RepID=A0AC35UDH9_9BILA